ncbi:MAG: ATP-binding protein, partial [bacterium]
VLLGGLLDLTASVLRVLPSVRLESSPRMADYARVLAAVDTLTGSEGCKRYAERAGSLATDSLTGDPFVSAMAETFTDPFDGTSAQLLEQITPLHAPDGSYWRPPRGWPRMPRDVTTLMRQQAPVMRKAGWTVDEEPPGHDNVVRWHIERP